ncbi:hypothetical protein AC579_3118 [Pseudocercospora musae]|uniref:Impact N-terminal domain-containing protein n=1 Tax=Pseudocercospora musae TaxID=113226 RepID=A0A139IA25_9PEZI|nr:hypothetical protein AC579_3118 [Pseudocercospora musae]
MSATELQALLRFLTTDAKVPLATAISKARELQAAQLDSPEALAKIKPDALQTTFPDEKIAKQVISAAKRVSKKRTAGNDTQTTPRKKRKESLFLEEPLSPAELEKSLELPGSDASEEELRKTVLFTNRAPLVLAFLVVLLKHSMPEQPLSSRLSLAQAYVSMTSRSRAVYLGIEKGNSAEDEGFGEGQPTVVVGGKAIKVIRRWGYEWKEQSSKSKTEDDQPEVEEPAVWALDLEALKKSGNEKQPAMVQIGNNSNLPVYTPQSARAYLVKSFDTAPASDAPSSKKSTGAAKAAEKEQNLGKLLRALDLLYESWATKLTPDELDGRTWNWYVKVRPAVAEGAAGWGVKNELRVADILDSRPDT